MGRTCCATHRKAAPLCHQRRAPTAHRQKHCVRKQAPCVHIGDRITLYLGDAHVIAPMLQCIDAMITDPPYGTNFDLPNPAAPTSPARSDRVLQPGLIISGDDVPFDPTLARLSPGHFVGREPLRVPAPRQRRLAHLG